MPMLMKMTTWNRRRRMIDRILYTIAAVVFATAAVRFGIAAYEWLEELKEHQESVDNVYPLQRRTL